MSNLTVIISAHVRESSNLVPIKRPERVIVESPLGGDYQRNLEYTRLCLRHAMLQSGESPMAFHLLYPQVLCDDTDQERDLGIDQSFAWHAKAQKKVFYLDRGFSAGMAKGLEAAILHKTPIEFRSLSMDSELVSVMGKLNSIPAHKLIVTELSKKLLARRGGNYGDHAEPGDLSGFRKFYKKDLALLEGLRVEPDENRQLLYPRVMMRDSLVNHGEAPLAMELVCNQLTPGNENPCTEFVSQPWELMADKIVVGIDAGIHQNMVERAHMLLAKGADLSLRSLANNAKLDEALERINRDVDPDARLGALVRDWKPILQAAGCDPHLKYIPYQRGRSSDLRMIAHLNKEAYASRERAFDDGLEPA